MKCLLETNFYAFLFNMKSKLKTTMVLLVFCLSIGRARSSDNLANDYLLSVLPNIQATTLAKVVGEGCVGKLAFYQGAADDRPQQSVDVPKLPGHDHDAYWNVKCTNGKSYVVQVSPTGAGQILECSMLKAVNGGHCFKKFK